MKRTNLSLATAIFFLGQLVASVVITERSAETLVAYGGEGAIDGLPVFYSDGIAYIGNIVPSGSNSNSNLSFTQSSTTSMIITSLNNNNKDNTNITTIAAAATNSTNTNNTNTTTTTPKSLYIDTTPSAFSPVGFTSNSTSTTAATTTGFLYYGAFVMWRSPSTGAISSLFYATPTAQEHLYMLKWNHEGVNDKNSVAVTLKKASR